MKYDKNGRFITSVGSKGSAPGQLNLPHTIAVDAKGNVYVGDRSNRRIQVFDNDLKLQNHLRQCRRAVGGLHFAGTASVSLLVELDTRINDSTLATVTGEIYKMELDGTIVGKFGKAGKQLGEFSGLHEIDCRNPDELFVSEIQLWRVQKIVLHPKGK